MHPTACCGAKPEGLPRELKEEQLQVLEQHGPYSVSAGNEILASPPALPSGKAPKTRKIFPLDMERVPGRQDFCLVLRSIDNESDTRRLLEVGMLKGKFYVASAMIRSRPSLTASRSSRTDLSRSASKELFLAHHLRQILFLSLTVLAACAVAAPLQAAEPPGPIRLEVDATRAPQKILHTHMEMPVKPGPLVLYYPQWIPGEHMPDGPIMDMAGLEIRRERKGDSLAPRPAGYVRVSSGYSAGCEHARHRFRLPALRADKGIFGGSIGHGLSGPDQLEPSGPLSPGLSGARLDLRAEPAFANGMEIRHGAARPESGWRH